MEIPATVTSKGQITIPIAVRKALGLEPGDHVIFRVADDRALLRAEEGDGREAELERVPNFLELAGTIPTPPDIDPDDWPAIRAAAWEAAAREYR